MVLNCLITWIERIHGTIEVKFSTYNERLRRSKNAKLEQRPLPACLAGESDHNQTTKTSHPTSILQLATLKASQAGELRYLGNESRFLVMIIGSSQASWVVAEGPFEVMGYKIKRLPACRSRIVTGWKPIPLVYRSILNR